MKTNRKECFYYNKYGDFDKETPLLKDLNFAYHQLLCLVNGNINFGSMTYPLIQASDPERLLKRIEVYLMAEKNKVKYIITGEKFNYSDIIVYFKNDKENAILNAFLQYHKYINNNDPLHPVDYISFMLQGFVESEIRNIFIRRYIQTKMPQKLQKQAERIDISEKIPYKDKYMKKYHLVEKYDNFKEFNQLFQKVKTDAQKILKDIKTDKNFAEFAKNVEIHDFKYDESKAVAGNPAFTPEVKHEVTKFKKSIK